MKLLAGLTWGEQQEPPIKHALKVRQSLSSGNFARFFKLQLQAPNMSGYLIHIFANKYRAIAIHQLLLSSPVSPL